MLLHPIMHIYRLEYRQLININKLGLININIVNTTIFILHHEKYDITLFFGIFLKKIKVNISVILTIHKGTI